MTDEKKGARSYKGQVIGDSYALTINFKWLLQLIAGTAIVVYFFWRMENRIQTLERHMDLALEEIELHDQERQAAEEQHIQDMESLLKTELNINPLSWKWGKNKGK
tara:strand:- start:290 stop:607 length:318 start_codon:yes stop_codon:yes gene_type:complete